MKDVLLVSEKKLKSFTTLNQNVDMALLVTNVYIAQELHLQPIIGTKGYEYYQDLVRSVNTGGTMSDADKILLEDYIGPVVIHGAHFESVPDIWMRQMNKGLVVGNTEQGQGVDINGMSYMRNIVNVRLQHYIQRLIDRIKAFPGDYPWYWAYTDKDGMKKQNQTIFTGMHIPLGGLRKPPRKGSWESTLPSYKEPCMDC